MSGGIRLPLPQGFEPPSEPLERRLRAAAAGPPHHTQLFTSLLLCLTAGDKNIAIRARDDNAITALATNVLQSTFGIPTHCLQARRAHTAADFLRDIFLVPPAPDPNASVTSKAFHPRRADPRISSLQRPDSIASTSSRQPARPLYHPDDASTYAVRAPSDFEYPRDSHLYPDTPTGLAFPALTPRLPHVLIVTKLEKAMPSVQHALSEILRTKRIVLEDDGTGVGGTWNLPRGFMVVYVCSTGSASERLPLQKGLLDRFGFSTAISIPEDPHHHHHVPRARINPLISADDVDHLQHLASRAYLSPHLQLYISSLVAATRHHPSLDGTLLTARCIRDLTDCIKSTAVISSQDLDLSLGSSSEEEDIQLYATESHVVRVFRNVVAHRLRVRDGPGDEILGSLVRSAVHKNEGFVEQEGYARGTVQAVLQEILADV